MDERQNRVDPESARQQVRSESSNVVAHNSMHSKRQRPDPDQHLPKDPATKQPRLMWSGSGFQSDNLRNGIRKMKSFNDLPSEMIHQIFDNIATTDLLNCRQVSRRCYDISSQIMVKRDDIALRFKSTGDDKKFVQKIRYGHNENLLLIKSNETVTLLGPKGLSDLVVCLLNSRHFPITSYEFDKLYDLKDQDIRSFLATWGEKIRSLTVTLRKSANVHKVLRKLLEKAPNLKKLEIKFYNYLEKPPFIGHPDDSLQWQLPKLEILRVKKLNETNLKVIENILTISPNLREVSFNGSNVTAAGLQMLESTKKLHCLKGLVLNINKKLISNWNKLPQCFDLQLESLRLTLDESILEDHQLKLSAVEMLNKLFRSSKDVLQSLTIKSLGSLTGLMFPKFVNLQNLCLQSYFSDNSSDDAVFPPSIDFIETFPNVKKLDVIDLNDELNSIFDLSLHLPSIQYLRVENVDTYAVRNLMKMAPNVNTLKVATYDGNIMVNFNDISTYLPKLENFGWGICCPNKPHKLDAFFTGLPANLCKKLAEKLRDKDRISAKEISAYRQKRCRASILDLKELKQFEIAFIRHVDDKSSNEDTDSDGESGDWTDGAGFGPNCPFYRTGVTKVSKLLAFDLIPKLKVIKLDLPKSANCWHSI